MPSIYRPRRPRASPLWQVVHTSWSDFQAGYETCHRKKHGPLSRHAVNVVRSFLRCGDISSGFTRLQCPDCGHERLLAFTCKGRYFCPACHQRRVRTGAWWIARELCHPVPHRQFVFTMPRPLRGIFRKRRELLGLLFQTATGCLRDWFRARLDLPEGRIAAVAAVQTFGDYLVFHPHLHVLAATGLFDGEGRFHLLPVESVEPLADLFRHRFLAVLRKEKLISEKKLRELLEWRHSGFSLDAGPKPVASTDVEGRQALAEYLLRAPFSVEKITWNATTRKVIYRSSRSWRMKRNFEVFSAEDFLAAAIEHIPPKSAQTVRYYGIYSNKTRGMVAKTGETANRAGSGEGGKGGARPSTPEIILAPARHAGSRPIRTHWRELIRRVWGADPHICPCCKGVMKTAGTFQRPEEIQFYLRLFGLWEGIVDIPPPPKPPYDVVTMEPLDPPPQWNSESERIEAADPDQPELFIEDADQSSGWKPREIRLDDGRILVLDD
ncbi:MAG: IS91 family transposase [Verrucomicrobiales bacterium]|nr:transposase [Verrucomicrobiota bacterium JB025]